MIAVDKMDSAELTHVMTFCNAHTYTYLHTRTGSLSSGHVYLTEVQFRGQGTSLDKFGSCCLEVTMASGRMEAGG